ncbi:MAG: apolipoprotein N-acyltransferase [Hyphomicrobiales bacterium]|nr:apolipoprotein N-acyltransferase [Hyphomicrobiales bacterium]MDE2114157.1 apolipoprotein N-acyltransferase [Hyphomicrobiales bacterium]
MFGPVMLTFAQRIMLAEGWQRAAIAFVSGAIGALALAPINFFPAFIVPMVVSVWLIDGCGESRPGRDARAGITNGLLSAAMAGWWLGFGYFVAGLWWLGAAFLVRPEFAWALPLGVLGLPAGLAFFTAFGFAFARLIWLPGNGRLLSLASGLALSEWLRGHLFTGFPWNDFGMVLGGNLALSQVASIIGLYGLTSLAIAIFASPAVLIDGTPASKRAVLLALTALASLAVFGLVRLSGGPVPTLAKTNLRIMQPNLVDDEKFSATSREKLISDYLALSDTATSPQHSGIADATDLIWPESAFPFILSRDAGALARIGSALPPTTTLITGAARLGEGRVPPVYNSMQVISHNGAILDSYDKVHLVPFGEYIPFAGLLDRLGLHQFTLSSFQAGDHRGVLHVPGLPPVAPLICYEAIFSGEVMPALPAGTARPGLMLNVTDDSWFGHTPGPAQHFYQARLRAVEEGLPLIRAADGGISAIIDPYGRIMESLPLGETGVLDGKVPEAIAETPFGKHPLWGPLTIWIVFLFSTIFLKYRI